MNARFISLDLAWSSRNTSAAVVLEPDGDVVQWIPYRERLGDNTDILSFLEQAVGSGTALIAIDAPLIVPNDQGARPVDRQITQLFGRYGAGCYPANRSRGCTRGEAIVTALAQLGFAHDPYLVQQAAVRTVFEVYPHPAVIALFSLEQTIKYKARHGRTLDFRQRELRRLRDHLLSLDSAKPAMTTPHEIATTDLGRLHAAALKRHEDLLDAAICAYVAYYAWYWGPQGYHVYGDAVQGYILVPLTASIFARLEQSARS